MKLWNYEKFADLYKAGGHYFYFHNSGPAESVGSLCDRNRWRPIVAQPRVLIDPNTYRKDGTAALNGEVVSWNGKLMAYAVAQAGSDWNEWRVREVASGKDLPDLMRWSKDEGVAWAPDDSGFYYARFLEPPPERLLTASSINQKVYFHKLGDAQTADKLLITNGPIITTGCSAR